MLNRSAGIALLLPDRAQCVMCRCCRQQLQAVLEINDRAILLAELVLREPALQMIVKKVTAPVDRAIVVRDGHVEVVVDQAHIAA